MSARLALAFAALLLAAGPAGASDQPAATRDGESLPYSQSGGQPAPPRETEPAPTQTSAPPAGAPVPKFLPPPRGSPRARVGGTSRGADAAAAALPEIEALVPSEAGWTSSESPVLYFHLSKPTAARIDFTLVDPDSVRPLAERTLPGPFAAGVHRVDLAELGVRLRAGVAHPWFVALVPDPQHRESDVVAGGAVERVPAGIQLAAELAAEPPDRAAFVLARHGLWVDAFDDLSRRIEREPDAAAARQQRDALLEQVGLAHVANAGAK